MELDGTDDRARQSELGRASDARKGNGKEGDGKESDSRIDDGKVGNDKADDDKKGKIGALKENSPSRLM